MEILQKASLEIIPHSISFANDLASGESISSVTVACVEALTGDDTGDDIVQSYSYTAQNVPMVIRAGETGNQYIITAEITTNYGNIFTLNMLLLITDPAPDLYTKSPDDNFVVAVDYSWDVNLTLVDSISSVVVTCKEENGSSVALISQTGFDINKAYLRVDTGGTVGAFYIIGVLITTALGYKFYEIIHLRVVQDA